MADDEENGNSSNHIRVNGTVGYRYQEHLAQKEQKEIDLEEGWNGARILPQFK